MAVLPRALRDRLGLRALGRVQLGERTIARFRKDADELYGDAAWVAAPRGGYLRAVRNRIVNLELISAEFTDLQR